MSTADVMVQPSRMGDVVLLAVCGTVDAYSVNSFSMQVQRALASAVKKVVLNCSAVTYMSSVGIGAVVLLHRELAKQGGALQITGMQHRVYEVFHLLGFTSVLSFADEDETAVALLNQTRDIFPATVCCVICQRKLKAPRAGSFRCPSCRTVLAVGLTAQVSLR